VAQDAERRSTNARIGAFAQQAKYDTRQTTRAARAEFLSRFEREVDPDGQLDPQERRRRAEAAKSVYFIKLGKKSGEARRRGR
jgi:hypothetical protein